MEAIHQHNHTSENELQYEISFRTEPEVIREGEPVKLYFRPGLSRQPNAVVPLNLLHEKKIHLIIVSKDLVYFAHKHPELLKNGEYVLEHTFPSGGEYLLFEDYLPEKGDQQLGRQEIEVNGEKKPEVSGGKVSTIWKEAEYQVSIVNDQDYRTQGAVMLSVLFTKNDKPIRDLEKYLGSLAHVVIISEDTREYLHVHAIASTTHGPEIMLHTHFFKSGRYKIFLEYKHGGQVRLATFVLAVKD